MDITPKKLLQIQMLAVPRSPEDGEEGRHATKEQKQNLGDDGHVDVLTTIIVSQLYVCQNVKSL